MAQHSERSDIARQALASAAPAVLWACIGCPFDVVKTRLQTAKTPFASALHCLGWTVRREGMQALWRGFVPLLLTSIPYSVIMFGTFQTVRPWLTDPASREGSGNIGASVVAGVASGVAVTVVHNPLELWRIRVQTHLPQYSDRSLVSIKASTRTTGTVLRGLMARPWQLGRGASMTLAENAIGNGTFFGANEVLRNTACGKNGSWAAEILVGGLTGMIFQIVVYPADLLKARLMTQEGVHVMQLARQMGRSDGIVGFYRGASVAIARAFAINAAGWPALKVAQWWLEVAP